MPRAAMDSASLEQIVTALLNQHGCCGGQGSEAAPLPSVNGVISVANDIRELLFPGVHQTRRPHSSDTAFEFQSRLARIESRLRIEIGRSLVHLRQVSLRLVNGNEERSWSGDMISADDITAKFLRQLPALRLKLNSDVEAAFNGDPAAISPEEILLCYPGIEAIFVYRIAHALLKLKVPYLPRIMTEWAHRQTGIDIHPGATIGDSFFIDHGTGVVIGETCVLGNNVTLYQGVTLGAWSFPRDEDGNLIRGTKRHPTLEDRVTVYSNATILGGTTVIGAGSLIGSSVSLNRSVPPNTIVTIERPSLRFRDAA